MERGIERQRETNEGLWTLEVGLVASLLDGW